MNRLILAPLSLSLAACYGAAPPRPARVDVPELSDEAVTVAAAGRIVIEPSTTVMTWFGSAAPTQVVG